MPLPPTPAQTPRGDHQLDLRIALALSLATLATRLPLMPALIASADGAGYAFGLDHFDPVLQHPQWPGYPLFILCARLLRLLTGDANRALLLMNVIPAAIAVPALYWLGCRMFSRTVGLTAAVLLLTCPNYWRTNLLWMSYTAGMCLSVLTATVLWEACRGDASDGRSCWRPSLVSALLLGLAGGFRLQVLVFLAPLWAWFVARRSWHQLLAGAAIIGACTFGWLAWACQASGGRDAALAAKDAQWREVIRPTSLTFAYEQGGLPAAAATLRSQGHLWFTFLFGGGTHVTSWAWSALILYALFAAARGHRPFAPPRAVFLALWLLPMTLFNLAIHINSQCHVIEYYPPLFLMAGVGLQHLVRDLGPVMRPGRHAAIMLIAICGLFNATLFMRSTYPQFAGEVAQVSDAIAVIHRDFDPLDTVLIPSYIRGQCYAIEYNLPEFRFYMLEPTLTPPRPSLEEATGVRSPLQFPPQVRHVVFLAPEARVDAPTRMVTSARGTPLLKVAEIAPEAPRLYFDKDGARFGK